MDTRGTETVLLVEDNDDLRKMLHGILTRQGYSLLMAANGAEGFEHTGRLRPGPCTCC